MEIYEMISKLPATGQIILIIIGIIFVIRFIRFLFTNWYISRILSLAVAVFALVRSRIDNIIFVKPLLLKAFGRFVGFC